MQLNSAHKLFLTLSFSKPPQL